VFLHVLYFLFFSFVVEVLVDARWKMEIKSHEDQPRYLEKCRLIDEQDLTVSRFWWKVVARE